MRAEEIIVVSNEYDDLHLNAELMRSMGMENDPEEENEAYFRGDFWIDCDKVKCDGLELRWNKRENYAVLDFDPHEFPEHVAIIRAFMEGLDDDRILAKYFDFDLFGHSWAKWEQATAGIAYRGGEGYTYGIYAWRRETGS